MDVTQIEQAAAKVGEQFAADVARAVAADERYAPLVGQQVEKVLAGLATLVI